ncbi:MAG: DNA primase [Aquificae bacterium]|nr:DNA primase [Aquificota bacterium]
MAISPETIEEVQRTANIYDVVSDYLDLKRAGASYSSLCPFHAEKTPSFYISPEKNVWKCFGCGKGGDPIKFVMEYEGLSFTQTILKLAEKYGIEIKYTDGTKDSQKLKGLFNVTEKISEFYFQQLKKSFEAKNYLINKRKLSPETIKRFHLGYSPESIEELLAFCKKEDISIEDLKKVGVLSEKSEKPKDIFAGRVIFPIRDLRGRVVAFGGRAIKENQNPKYINSPQTQLYQKKDVLYGMYESRDYTREKRTAVLTEGYIDVLSMYQVGIKNVMAPLGTALTKNQAKQIKRFAKKVVLMFDADKAGKKAVISAAKVLLSEDIDVLYAPLPEGEDADGLAKKGYKAIHSILNEKRDIFIFLIEQLEKLNTESTENHEDLLKKRYKLINLYLELLAYVKNTAKRIVYHQALSQVTGLPLEALSFSIVKENKSEDKVIDSKLSLREKIVLKALIHHKDELLEFVDDFSKISSSGYFLHLTDLILNNQLSQEEKQMIENFDVPHDINVALEAIQIMENLQRKKSILSF